MADGVGREQGGWVGRGGVGVVSGFIAASQFANGEVN